MSKTRLPIANGFYVSQSVDISNQRCVNWRPNIPQSDTVTEDNLFPTEGLEQLTSVSISDQGRGIHEMNSILYCVIGTSLYRLNRLVDILGNESFTTDNLGTIEGQDKLYMADNGVQLCIVAVPDDVTTGKSYIFTDSPDTLTEITDVNFDGPAASVVYVDGYFSFHKSDGKKIFNSPLNNGLTGYDPLDFTNASADPDQIRAQIVWRNQLYVGGSLTFQAFRNIGRTPAPFQSSPGSVIDVGIVAPLSLKNFAGGIVFVGAGDKETPSVWNIVGAQKQKISTIAIDNELAKLSEAEAGNIYAWVYGDRGSYQYGITLPDTTFVYDQTNSRWHERVSKADSVTSHYRVAGMEKAYGRVIVIDELDGRIGAINEKLYTEYDILVRRFATSKPFDNLGRSTKIGSIEAVIESGVGLENDISILTGESFGGIPEAAETGTDPQITLSWSDDNRTYKGGLSRSMGKIGQYKKRPIWRRLGRFSRSRTLMIECTTPNNAVLIKMEASIG